jgi:hypothetical protein
MIDLGATGAFLATSGKAANNAALPETTATGRAGLDPETRRRSNVRFVPILFSNESTGHSDPER